MPKSLLVEIGCEEIPARMVGSLARQFGERLSLKLSEAGLAAEAGTVHWTPRRLIFKHSAVLERQPEGTELVLGPPVRVAVAADGSFTPQAVGFAAKNDAQASALVRVTTPKGEYVALNMRVGGNSAHSIICAAIPQAFGEIELPRSMRWDGEMRFIRPVRWLLALLGDEVIPFRLGELTAGAVSRGHRLVAQPEFTAASSEDYPRLWEEHQVVGDPEARRERILAGAERVLKETGCRLRMDAELLDTLVNLTERPDAVLGGFKESYIRQLPPEVLVTVMRDHQKYFAVEDGRGELAPYFVAIMNRDGDPQGLIRHGNERVLRARFSDAQFFWEQDRKLTLAQRLPLLEAVTFHAKLGSYGQKSRRMKVLAAWLAERWPECDRAAAAEAAELAKCDLTTDLVKEFTELQGIMGGHYARAEGRSEEVAVAVADQYVWETAPRSVEGAAVSVADKLDTIAGMFAIGEVPSGSADPFALRRQGNGLIRALVECALPLSLSEAWKQALAGYGEQPGFRGLEETERDLTMFFQDRLGFYLTEVKEFPRHTVAGVLAAGADRPLEAVARCRALASAPDLAAVAAVVKRARNIVRKEKWTSTKVEPDLLAAAAEQALLYAVEGLPEDADYEGELRAISELAGPLERFFTEVRVNDDDPAVRGNRLSLLAWTVQRLSRIADFSAM